jgi:hypothetical protein
MKKQYLSVSDLGRRGVDALRASAPQHGQSLTHAKSSKLDDKCCGFFQIASGATTFQCHARGPVKLILVRFILHSTCDWSISYLRGTFGV